MGRKRTPLSELAALNEEARARHVSYGRLMASTTEKERVQIVEKWRRNPPKVQGDAEEHG